MMEPFAFLKVADQQARTRSKPQRAIRSSSFRRFLPPKVGSMLKHGWGQTFFGSIIAVASITLAGISPASAQILGGDEVLQEGDIGPNVGALQRQLRNLGLYNASDTDVYGPLTKAAVEQYQRSLGLPVDGIFGAQTDQALFGSLLPQVAAPVTQGNTFTLGQRMLSLGSQGSDVRDLQTLLSTRFSPLVSDGIFGSSTDSVVRAFQQRYGLVSDGIVGAETIRTLQALSGTATTASTDPITGFPTVPIQSTLVSAPPPSTTPNAVASLPADASPATRRAAQINTGPYVVVIPADSDDLTKLGWVRGQLQQACITQSRRGSYIFAGSFQEYGAAQTRRLELRANRPANASRTDARIHYRDFPFTVECIR